MNTDSDAFTKLNKHLTENRPDYVPHYLILERNSKEPISGRPWKGAQYRVCFEDALKWIRAGFNIGIAGTDTDGLVIIDVDRAGAIMDIKLPTLVDRSRKRTGSHYFYWTDDPKAKVNIPTEKEGEVRSNYQYVVCAGSYVPTTLESLKAEDNPIPPDDQIALLGKYTIEVAMPPVSITFAEFPKIFRDQALRAQISPTKKQRLKHEREDADGPTSKLWSRRIEDIVGDIHTAGERFPSIFHDSATGHNTSVTPSSEDGPGLIHCWRHGVSLTPLQAMAVLAGLGDCVDIGEAHKNSMAGHSTLHYTRGEVMVIWEYAKAHGVLPSDDPNPLDSVADAEYRRLLESLGLGPDSTASDGEVADTEYHKMLQRLGLGPREES